MRYYSYLLQERTQSLNHHLHMRKLTQEFQVDAYVQTEQNRLRFHQQEGQQRKYRRVSLLGLSDATATQNDLKTVGKPCILPSSFTGSPRDINQRYYDAMASYRALGSPDLFITATTNPQWKEIKERLLPGENAIDRPDICTRVFNLKFNEMIVDLTVRHVLGRVLAYTYAIEFQKRGFPHGHVLLTLHPDDKPKAIEDIDSIVSAEIPNESTYPHLFETISMHMLHGPCGRNNTHAPCTTTNPDTNEPKCGRKYPRDYCDETIIHDGYPIYRRRNNGSQVHVRGSIFTNQHVVPYNPFLSQKYNCHINVEIATSITAVKYIYKYIHKGEDRAAVTIDAGQPRNEIQEYIEGRYLTAPQACWKLFSFKMYDNSPTVVRLDIHLEQQQTISFDPNNPNDVDVRTKLTQFFKLCQDNPQQTSDLLYPDCPQHYTWTKEKTWSPRTRNTTAIGRIYFIPPTAGDLYYLRILLYHVPGPTSFRYLRTFNGHTYGTFQEACNERGLANNEREWHQCLQEASQSKTGNQLRHLFAVILHLNSPPNPQSLFNDNFSGLSDDIPYLLSNKFHIDNPSEQQIYSLTLLKIQEILDNIASKTLRDCGLPLPPLNFGQLEPPSQLILEETSHNRENLRQHSHQQYLQANCDQRAIVDAIQQSVLHQQGKLFFLDGPGGTGKTFTENLILDLTRSQGKIALAVASSGIAALLLHGGRTAHSRFKIPIQIDDKSLCNVDAHSKLAKLLRSTHLIVWDEAPAQHRYCFQAVDRTLKDICQNQLWFGGITTVFAGTTPFLFQFFKPPF
jgi:hypothetical protein